MLYHHHHRHGDYLNPSESPSVSWPNEREGKQLVSLVAGTVRPDESVLLLPVCSTACVGIEEGILLSYLSGLTVPCMLV